VPAFDEVIEFAQKLGRQLGRPIGIYPETKPPSYFRSIGIPLEERLLDSLERHGWNSRESPVFIQSFEENLRQIRPKTTVRLIRLLERKSPTDTELREIRSYADGIEPNSRHARCAKSARAQRRLTRKSAAADGAGWEAFPTNRLASRPRGA
jgi:glycerophosphoryl diester phosphodiesterase